MNPILHGVMAYEDFSIAKLAKEKWDFMVNALQHGYDFELQLWGFDTLRIPALRNVAVNKTAKAHMVLIATLGTGELPIEAKMWIEQWLALKERQQDAARVLIFLFDSPPDKSGAYAFSQFAYLQHAARKGSMDFLATTASAMDQDRAISLHVSTGGMRSWESTFRTGVQRAIKQLALS
jgi:hypothetical protein